MSSILNIISIFLMFGNSEEVISDSMFCSQLTVNTIRNVYTNQIFESNGKIFSTIGIITESKNLSQKKFIWDLEKDIIGRPLDVYTFDIMARIAFPPPPKEKFFCGKPSTDCQKLIKLFSKTLTFYKNGNHISYEFKKVVNFVEEGVKNYELPFNMIPKGSGVLSFILWPEEWIKSPKPVATYDLIRNELVFISKSKEEQYPKFTKIWTNSLKSDDWRKTWNERNVPLVDLNGLVTILRGHTIEQNFNGVFGFEFSQNIFEYKNKSLIKIDTNYRQFFGCDHKESNKTLIYVLVVIIIIILALIPFCFAVYYFTYKKKNVSKKTLKKDDNDSSVITPMSSVKTVDSETGKPLVPTNKTLAKNTIQIK